MALPIWDGPMQTQASLQQWARGSLALHAAKAGMKVPDLDLRSDTAPLLARVNHNKWIVDCPDCGGAEFVWPELLMMCANCWNGAVGHKWRRVRMPAERAEIEAVLTARPVPATRNWEITETVAQLQEENTQKGLPVG